MKSTRVEQRLRRSCLEDDTREEVRRDRDTTMKRQESGARGVDHCGSKVDHIRPCSGVERAGVWGTSVARTSGA